MAAMPAAGGWRYRKALSQQPQSGLLAPARIRRNCGGGHNCT
jgi:hypothetical protein